MSENKADYKTIWVKTDQHRKLKILASVKGVQLNKLVGDIITEYCSKNLSAEENSITK
jgi:hypothetical protein